MAQNFKETAHLNTDLNKYRDNYDGIDWGKKIDEHQEAMFKKLSEPIMINAELFDELVKDLKTQTAIVDESHTLLKSSRETLK